MLNKDNYVSWSSRLLCYGITKSTQEQTDDELIEKEVKQMEADDQAIQTILMGLLEDIYAALDSCDTKIWLRVKQLMKGYSIRVQEKKAKLFNELERFTSTEGESIESYYHRFSKLMNGFSKNIYFLKKIVSNLKFLNNLQPKWQRYVTIVHQTKDLHEVDYIQLYDFLKLNQAEVDAIRAKRLAKEKIDLQIQRARGNGGNQFRQYAGQNAGNQIGYNAGQIVGNQNRYNAVHNGYNVNGLIVVLGIANPNVNPNGNGNVITTRAKGNRNGNNGNQIRCYNCRGLGHFARNCTVRPMRRDATYLQTQLQIAQKEEARIQLQAKEFDLMTAAGDIDEIKEVNANCILMENLQKQRHWVLRLIKLPSMIQTDQLRQVRRKERTKAKNAKKYTAHFTMYAALPIKFEN
ncbi:putative ribonuclease H-like domain-containing protein [Tanacetum coccineum]|uniref:Ribonuclease H-like domain-containing protein n=1 Tax=Tanacetum coccineum TaxID=301880 RepID=A0ABQ4Z962_9ASTR